MTRSSLFYLSFFFCCTLITQSCSDSKIEGRRNDIFEHIDYLRDKDMTSAFASDPSVIKNWTMDGENLNKTCKNAYVEGVNPYQLSEKWKKHLSRFKNEIEYIATPVIFNGKIFYLSQNSELFSIDLDSGEVILKKQLLNDVNEYKGNSSYGGIGLDEHGNLFISLIDKTVVAVSVLDGNFKIIWSQNIGGVGSSPIIYKNIVLVKTEKNTLYALNKENGQILWTLNTVTDMTSLSKIGSVSVFDNKVFVTMQNLENYILDINTGEVIGLSSLVGKSYFSSPLSFISAVVSPVVDGEIMLSGNTENLISAVSYSGNIINKLWSLPIGIYVTPCVSNGFAFVATSSNKLLALNMKNGKVVWDVDLTNIDDKDFYIIGIVLINNNLIMNTNRGEFIYVNSITGELVRRQKLSSGFVSQMVIVDNNIITIDSDGNMVNYALEYRK